jgi:peroxiredoxin
VPALQQAYARFHGAKGLVVVGVDATEDGAQDVTAFAQEHGATYTMLLDPDSITVSPYRLDALPHSFLIDRAGVIRRDLPLAFQNAHDVESALAAIL